VLVIAATNRPWDIDDALRRPGRFSSMLFVGPPDLGARQQIFHNNLKNMPCADDIDIDQLARKTCQFSSADVKQVCSLAQTDAFREAMISGQIVAVSQATLLSCLQQTKPSTLTWLDTARSYITHSNASGIWNDIKDYLEVPDDEKMP
jgi:SpoVK/Ycf46/Vps4 family AAA+-type ATPase